MYCHVQETDTQINADDERKTERKAKKNGATFIVFLLSVVLLSNWGQALFAIKR